jgi:hypothetical protein
MNPACFATSEAKSVVDISIYSAVPDIAAIFKLRSPIFANSPSERFLFGLSPTKYHAVENTKVESNNSSKRDIRRDTNPPGRNGERYQTKLAYCHGVETLASMGNKRPRRPSAAFPKDFCLGGLKST